MRACWRFTLIASALDGAALRARPGAARVGRRPQPRAQGRSGRRRRRRAARAAAQDAGRRAGGAVDAARRRRRALRPQPGQPHRPRPGLRHRPRGHLRARPVALRPLAGGDQAALQRPGRGPAPAAGRRGRRSAADQAVLTGNASQRTIRVPGLRAGPGRGHEPVDPGDRAAATSPRSACRCSPAATSPSATPTARRSVAIVNETFARYYFGERESDWPALRLQRPQRSGDAWRSSAWSRTRSIRRCGPARLDDAASCASRPATGMPRVVYTPYQQSDELSEMTRLPAPTAAGGAGACRAWPARRCSGPIASLPVFRMTTLGGHRRRRRWPWSACWRCSRRCSARWRLCWRPSASTAS